MKAIDSKDISLLKSYFAAAGRIVIATHTHPDGDALGSSFALRHYLTGQGKEVSVAVPDKVGGTLEFILTPEDRRSLIVISEEKERFASAATGCDLLVCLDLNGFHRCEGAGDTLRAAGCRKVLIDHHIDPQREDFDLVFSEEEISSASELLFWILEKIEGGCDALPERTAYCLMVGMTTDTNNFANSVYPSTFSMASALISRGVDRDSILGSIYNNYAERRFRLMGYLLKDKLTITEDGVAYMVLRKEEIASYGIMEGDTEAFVNIPLGIDRVRMSIFLKEQGDTFRVSIRSKKGVSANTLAKESFNGGGHEMAAGGKLRTGVDLADAAMAEEYIEKATKEFFK